MTRIVALASAGEYNPEVTLPRVAGRIAVATHARLDVRTSDIAEDVPDFPLSTFGDLSVLDDADLLILALRFRNVSDDELAALAAYVDSGRPIIALRTSNHAFATPEERKLHAWAQEFPATVLGSAWISHHGHTSTTRVTRVADSALLDGLPEDFVVDSWLYVAHAPADATVLLWGEPIDPETEPTPSPVAWIREIGGQRVFYTSLGSESDLERPEVLRLLENAARWCLAVGTEDVGAEDAGAGDVR
ncbi:ThuA domain-containing protein [Promicromonospora sp. Populi]|uniref:ThuA domain-containing protein n=1 Tax=Promicromonospora sp. Populi TaxID=3239420 RepID=UPI0034E2D339